MNILTPSGQPVKASSHPPVSGTCRWIRKPSRDARAILAINGVHYAIWFIHEGERLTGFRLMSAAGKVYDLPVSLDDCSCPDSTFRPRPGGCKHVKSLRAALAALAA